MAGKLLNKVYDVHGCLIDTCIVCNYTLNEQVLIHAIRSLDGKNLLCDASCRTVRNAVEYETPWQLVCKEQRRIRNDPEYRRDLTFPVPAFSTACDSWILTSEVFVLFAELYTMLY
jgi:hypothetical protein